MPCKNKLSERMMGYVHPTYQSWCWVLLFCFDTPNPWSGGCSLLTQAASIFFQNDMPSSNTGQVLQCRTSNIWWHTKRIPQRCCQVWILVPCVRINLYVRCVSLKNCGPACLWRLSNHRGSKTPGSISHHHKTLIASLTAKERAWERWVCNHKSR